MKYSRKEVVIDLFYDVIGSFLYAIGVYTFASAANFAPGGITGLALILNHLTGLPIGLASLIWNVPILIFTFKALKLKFFIKSAKTMIISTLFIDVIMPLFPYYDGDPLLASIFAGILIGAGCALVYSRGSSTGGIDFLIMLIKKKYPHLSMGQIINVLNIFVILVGGFVFKNFDAILFGLITSFADTLVLDRILYGIGSGKVVMIVSNKGNAEKIADSISRLTKRGSTFLKAMGSYSNEEKDFILCACSNSQFHIIKNGIYEIDPNALVMITESNEVFGQGFRNYKEN